MVTATAKEILRRLGRPFEATITAYLNSKYDKGIEIIEEDPRKFYSALKELFGEFAAKIFIYNLVAELHLPVKSTEIEDLLQILEEYIGG
ncbi:NitrOD5 domain-containing protein [Thermococcus gammatolerans]|nr:NitrOD5 domain-containing protein [Thermococcus gammatolerans]